MAQDPSQTGEQEETETINVVPLADLTLVLLIILMVLSPMITQSMIQVSTPSVKADKKVTVDPEEEKEKKNQTPLILSVLSGGGYTLNNVPVDELEQLVQALSARLLENPDRAVLVTGDPDVTVGAIVELLDLAKQNGAQKVSLLKKAEPSKKS